MPTEAIRNIGIIAHIDAGKTTLTERILHLTNSLTLPGLEPPTAGTAVTAPGDVDTGSTVTDFLEEERERGITIQSAAVGPVWWSSAAMAPAASPTLTPEIAISLVDTPGHIDFGIEVERTVRVVDGAVVVLDGVEGVESQSENVWRQTKRYGVDAHIFFINKLDRAGASVARSLRSIVDRGLHPRPVLLQLPALVSDVGEDAGDRKRTAATDDPLIGVIDLLSMELLRFEGMAGEQIVRVPLDKSRHAVYDEAARARAALIELVSSRDEALLDQVLSADDADAAMATLSAADVQAALRRLTLQGDVCPVLLGAAAVNIGVQPLLNAIATYLPSPLDRPPVDGVLHPDTPQAHTVTLDGAHPSTTALAFKVVWDKRKGPITFVRVYSGVLRTATALMNTTTHAKERLSKLLLPYADQYVEVTELRAGQIGVVMGLRDTRTGDTLVDMRKGHHSRSLGPPRDLRTLRLRRVYVPPAVFSVSVEPRSKADEAAVLDALRMLVRTDPSLHVEEGGVGVSAQTVLSGMGELHLEIAKHRLDNEFQAPARFGEVRVGYRETVAPEVTCTATELFEQDVQGKPLKIKLDVRVQALSPDQPAAQGGNDIMVDAGPDELVYDSGATLSETIVQGARAALARGPLSGYPLQGLAVHVSNVETFGPELSSPTAARMAMAAALRKALGYAARPRPGEPVEGHTRLMEPMMRVLIEAPETYAGKLASDISVEQNGHIIEVSQSSTETDTVPGTYEVYIPDDADAAPVSERRSVVTVEAQVPLARMMRYSTRLRALTGGAGSYQMALHGFGIVAPARERELLQQLGRLPRA